MPYVGEIVNYVLGNDSAMPGEIRPAIIVRVWSEVTVNLQVFTDGTNDYPAYFVSGGQIIGVHWKTSIPYSDDYQPGTWHYFILAVEMVSEGG